MRPKKENEIENKNKKRKKLQKLPTKCEICGQICRFRYYNVQCCESCKQFFRRIVIKQKEFHCLKFWTCDFAKGERCRGCRLDKCLQLGMDPTLVNVPKSEQLNVFLAKLEKRREKLMDPNYTKYKLDEPKPGSIEEIGQNSMSPEGIGIFENDFDGTESIELNSPDSQFSEIDGFNFVEIKNDISVENDYSFEMKIHQQKNNLLMCKNSCFSLQTNLPNFDVLLKMEEKIRKIHYSCTELTPNYFDNFNGIEEILLRMDNLMAMSEQFSNEKAPHWIRPFVIESIQKRGIWARKPVYYIRDLLMVMDFARTIPIYSQLSLEDQITLISSFTLSASRMIVCFYSIERNSQTMLLPNGMPISEQFKVGRFANDPVLETLPKKVYDYPVSAFQKVKPNREEFILLLNLIFLNSATSGLSTHCQQLLKEEAEKYGKILLQWQQNRLGEQAGALRYMETMSLIWNSNANAQKYRELLVYLDAVYEQGQFEKVMPKMLAKLCLNGPRELPNLSEF